jgi:Leu/Phe-tRNA-protein transferase
VILRRRVNVSSRPRTRPRSRFVALVELLREGHNRLPRRAVAHAHLASLGARELDRPVYLKRLENALAAATSARWQ